MPNEQDYIYLAGCVDCDGTITINEGNNEYTGTVRLSISNTNSKLTSWAEEIFGGSIGSQDRKLGYKIIYKWYIGSEEAVEIIKMILPYLKLKKEQAIVAIEWQKHMGKYGCGGGKFKILPEEIRERLLLRKQMFELNKRARKVI